MRRCACSIVVLCASCSDPLPAVSTLDKLRLLAIEADAPEVHAGAGDTVRALWFDGSAQAPRTVHFLWRICVEPTDGNVSRCLDPSVGTDLARRTDHDAPDLAITPAQLALGDAEDSRTYVVVLAMCPTLPPVFDTASSQYACPTDAGLASAQREGIQSFRRITVRRAGTPLDTDPVIANVTVDGTDTAPFAVAACATPPCATHALGLSASASTTDLLASVYVSRGTVDVPRLVLGDAGGPTTASFTPPGEPGTVTAFWVLRDERGGESSRRFTIDVR